MTFLAEITEIKAKKTASLDKVFRLIIETDQDITELQKYIATEPVVVSVEGDK
jgi:hypothetical protein